MQKQSKNWPGVQYPLNMLIWTYFVFCLLKILDKDTSNILDSILVYILDKLAVNVILLVFWIKEFAQLKKKIKKLKHKCKNKPFRMKELM